MSNEQEFRIHNNICNEMMLKAADKGRNLPDLSSLFLITCTIISGIHSKLQPILGISLPVIAAFLCSCEMNMNLDTAISRQKDSSCLTLECRSSSENIGYAHALTFNADSLGWLDCYQYIEEIENGSINIASTDGKKHSYIYANVNLSKDDIAAVKTAEDLEKLSCHLEDVQRGMPPMIGFASIDSGSGACAEMRNLMSEIELKSICCDFSGTSYEGESITDARIYLTNVNAEVSLSGKTRHVRRVINAGRLSQNDLDRFADPGMIARDLGQDIGKNRFIAGITLRCFHNESSEEGPGSPFTRLILEGRIQGTTYYWPVTINRANAGNGICSNCRYVYDLTIRRKGCLDPEGDIDDIYVDVEEEVKFSSFPDSYIRGDIGDTLHLWCEFSPYYAPFDIGLEELEEDESNGIYDYIIDEDGHGVRLILKKPGSGLVYMKVGAPVNEAALWVIEVNLPEDTSQYTTSRMISAAPECRQKQDSRLHLQPQGQDLPPNPPRE